MTVNILSADSRLRPTDGAIRLLTIEDDDLDAERLFRHLRRDTRTRWRVHWARSLGEALDLIAAHRFDAALVDLRLPDADGLPIVQALVAADPLCPLVIQSGIDDAALESEALAAGAQDYLRKSVMTPGALARSINHAITRHRLRVTQAALRETHDELDDFAHVVAHDLRAPVRTARLLANRLLVHVDTVDERATDLGHRLDRALGRLDRMVLGMLDYSGLRALEIEIEPVRLVDVVTDVVADVQADGEHVELDVAIEVDEDTEVLANREMLGRVFLNLLTNSVKFAKPATPLLVTITAGVAAGAVTVTVSDNGIGIPAGAHEQVFGLTERLDHCREGLGFGLAIVRRCMGKMDGSIHFDPAGDDGATAVLELRSVPPVEAVVADHEPVELAPEPDRSSTTVSGL